MPLPRWMTQYNANRFLYQNIIQPNYPKVILAIAFLLAYPLTVLSEDFDGSKPLHGVTGKIIEINRYKIVSDIDPDTIGLPKKFLIDFKSNTLRPSKDSLVRRSIGFSTPQHIENKIILQGVDTGVEGSDDGLAWSLTISKKDGSSVLSASGDSKAYVVFGTCTPVESTP